jgi:hypothetical protein
MLDAADIVASALGVGVAVNAVFAYSFGSAMFRRGAPFGPSAEPKIRAIFGSGGLLHRVLPRKRRHSMHALDLGSGGGALVRAAVRMGGFGRGTGVEINPALVVYSQMLSALTTKERFIKQCLWEANVSDADLVFVYGLPSIMGDLEQKLQSELPTGALVVLNAFPFPVKPHHKQHAAGNQLPDSTTTADGFELLESRFVTAGLQNGSLDDSSNVYLYRLVRNGTGASKCHGHQAESSVRTVL